MIEKKVECDLDEAILFVENQPINLENMSLSQKEAIFIEVYHQK